MTSAEIVEEIGARLAAPRRGIPGLCFSGRMQVEVADLLLRKAAFDLPAAHVLARDPAQAMLSRRGSG